MEIIKNFGLDPVFLVAQIINFLIILYVLRRFLYKPVLDLLKKRQDIVKEGLMKAEEANQRLEKVVEEEKNIIRNAQMEAKKIVDDVKIEAAALSEELEENAKEKAQKLLKDAREQISRQAIEIEKRLTLNISRIALKFLQKSLRDLFSEKEQEKLMEKALLRLGKKR